jgi:ferredoxin
LSRSSVATVCLIAFDSSLLISLFPPSIFASKFSNAEFNRKESLLMSNSFESFLNQHDDADWLQVLFKLESQIHPVDQRATRVWFAFFPLKLKRAFDAAADRQKFETDLTLKGKYLLAEQVDESAHFLYGHRYWPQVKQAVAAHAETAHATVPLYEQIADVAGQVAAQVRADKSLLVGITAVAFMMLEHIGLEKMKQPAVMTVQHPAKSPEQILSERNTDDSQGLFGFLRTVDKRFTVTFNENKPEAKFRVVNMQDITMAAAEDKRPHHLTEPRCKEGEGPIPVECRTCACGTCWVGVLSDTSKLSPPAAREIDKATTVFCYDGFTGEKDSPIRMACQVKCYGNVTIVIPPWHGLLWKLKSQSQAANGD